MPIGRLLKGAVAFAALAFASAGAMAQDAANWPSKPIRVIVNFAPGGSADNSMRPFAEPLGKMLGQPVVIENRGGASGAIGLEAGTKAPADGYNFVVTPGLSVAILPNVRKTPYDPFKDLVPVAWFTYYPMMFAVHPSVPANTLQEFVTYLKANPGKVSLGSSGIASTGHLLCEAFNRAAGVDILHVPYRGSNDALNDFLAGVVQVFVDPTVQSHVKAGKAKLLAVTGERLAEYPDVPAMSELYPSADFRGWNAMFAPAGTPDAVVRKMNEAINKVAKTDEIRTPLFGGGLFPHAGPPEDLAKILRSDYDRYGKLVKELNIRLD